MCPFDWMLRTKQRYSPQQQRVGAPNETQVRVLYTLRALYYANRRKRRLAGRDNASSFTFATKLPNANPTLLVTPAETAPTECRLIWLCVLMALLRLPWLRQCLQLMTSNAHLLDSAGNLPHKHFYRCRHRSNVKLLRQTFAYEFMALRLPCKVHDATLHPHNPAALATVCKLLSPILI